MEDHEIYISGGVGVPKAVACPVDEFRDLPANDLDQRIMLLQRQHPKVNQSDPSGLNTEDKMDMLRMIQIVLGIMAV